MHTPWGPSQSQKKIADGIIFYETASHGGIKLSQERFDQMPKELQAIKPWADHLWYEEDCDYGIIILAFPQFFTIFQVFTAVNSRLKEYAGHVDALKVFFATEGGKTLIQMHDQYLAVNKNRFEITSEGTGGTAPGWRISARTLDGTKRMHATVKGTIRPTEPFTEAEARAVFETVTILDPEPKLDNPEQLSIFQA